MPTHITILGSGTGVPSLTRNPCAVLVKTGGRNLLLDCGAGVMRRLLEVGVAIYDIAYLFLSHFHPDHAGELAALLFALKHPPSSVRPQPLTVVAGQGFHAFYAHLQAAFGNCIVPPPERFEVIEMDVGGADRLTFPGFRVASTPVAHHPESLAYRIVDACGKTVVYSGDSDRCEGLAAIAAAADVMICEAAFPDALKTDGHLTPSLAGAIARDAGVKRLVLTHFYPSCEGVDIEKECRSAYSGAIVLARDKMTLTV